MCVIKNKRKNISTDDVSRYYVINDKRNNVRVESKVFEIKSYLEKKIQKKIIEIFLKSRQEIRLKKVSVELSFMKNLFRK